MGFRKSETRGVVVVVLACSVVDLMQRDRHEAQRPCVSGGASVSATAGPTPHS